MTLSYNLTKPSLLTDQSQKLRSSFKNSPKPKRPSPFQTKRNLLFVQHGHYKEKIFTHENYKMTTVETNKYDYLDSDYK